MLCGCVYVYSEHRGAQHRARFCWLARLLVPATRGASTTVNVNVNLVCGLQSFWWISSVQLRVFRQRRRMLSLCLCIHIFTYICGLETSELPSHIRASFFPHQVSYNLYMSRKSAQRGVLLLLLLLISRHER